MIWKDDHLLLLDQRSLPGKEEWLKLETPQQVAEAIADMAVRGAPAIGIAAAYGMALSAHLGLEPEHSRSILAASRPTAVNLFWALERIGRLQRQDLVSVLGEARAIEQEDLDMNLKIGAHGDTLIQPGSNILTICNTGALATAGHGTALGIIRSAHQQGKGIHVWSCETRPRQQGLRLTAYELLSEDIPFHSIADSAAATLMKDRKVDCVVVGADRIASNGDSANKIGTYMLAVLAHHHQIPFYVAAPTSTFDYQISSGKEIRIEERAGAELTHIGEVEVAPPGCKVFNPAFDVTPGSLITAIVTEAGIYRPVYNFQEEVAEAR